MRRVYLDHNATTPLRPEAREAMLAALAAPGNASSVHAEGRAARALVEEARLGIAEWVGAPARGVVFVSGGTEALNLVLTPSVGAGDAPPYDLLLMSAGEHAAVLSGHRFPAERAALVPLTAEGVLDLAALETALAQAEGARVMLALQAANNETGVVQPVAEAARLVHAANGFLVCDAVQAAGKIDCRIEDLGADALILSAHKFGGPQGVGALCFAASSTHIGHVMMRGGGQERGARAGTENVAGVAAAAAAAAAAQAQMAQASKALAHQRDAVEAGIARIAAKSDAAVSFFGQSGPRLPNTSCFALSGVEAQLLLMMLDVDGVAVSSGSACSSGKVKRSHVLAAMGVAADLAGGAIRVSLGWNSSDSDGACFIEAFEKAVSSLKARRSKAKGEAA